MDEEELKRLAMEAEGGNGQPVVNAPPAIDYAKLFEEQKAQTAIIQAQLQQTLATQQQLIANQSNQQNVQQVEVDPYADFNPETAKALRAVTDNLKKGFEQKLAQQNQQFTQLQQETAFTAFNAKYPPAIVERAKVIFTGMKSNGTPLNTADAIRFAVGEAVEAGTFNPAQQQTRNAPAVVTGGSRQPTNKTKPANYETLPWREQEKILVAAGIENEEF